MVDQTSQFYAILTTVGAAKQANADALGIPWKITQMAVGDGNPTGSETPALPMPDASARALLNEWRRAPLNQLKVDDKNNAVIVAEQVIPADVGGRWIRELALFDAEGDMVAVANCAPTYKPLLNQGSGRTQVVRMNLIVSSSSNVQLKIDPSVVLATREWVTEELAKQDFKHSVLAATTAAITLSGLQTVDGVVLPAGARVLVKNQAAGKDNGLYLVVAGGAWTRCSDANTSAKVTPGMLVPVEKGTTNADTAWQLVTDAPITLGVSVLVFEMAFGRTGVAAGNYRSVTVDIYGRVVAAANPTTVAGYGLTDVYTKTQNDQALALKAPLASPALTGTPTVPLLAATDNSSKIASSATVRAIVADLKQASTIDTTPGAILSVGAFGAGAGILSTEVDMNNYQVPGNYLTPLAGLLHLPAGWASSVRYSVVVDGFSAVNYLVQTITSGLSQGTVPAVAIRTMSVAGEWSEWQIVLAKGNLGLGGVVAPVLSDFKAITPGGFYLAYGALVPNLATPNAPPGSTGNVLGVMALTPRNDCTYYYAFENAISSGTRRFWVGQYNLPSGSLFWSQLLSNEDFESSVGASGFQHYPGGLIRQWGTFPAINVPAANYGSLTIMLPKAFPNGYLNGNASVTNQGLCNAQPRPNGLSKTSILVVVNNSYTSTLAPSGTWEVWGY